MAIDMFLKIDDIPGESKDAAHKDEIDVLAWSWGVSQSGTLHLGQGGGAGKASFQDLSVTKWVDLASVPLMRHCATGETFSKATLTVRKAGKQPLEYYIIDMERVLVTSVGQVAAAGEDQITENVTLNFAKVEVRYKEQTEDGSPGRENELRWDVLKNQEG